MCDLFVVFLFTLISRFLKFHDNVLWWRSLLSLLIVPYIQWTLLIWGLWFSIFSCIISPNVSSVICSWNSLLGRYWTSWHTSLNFLTLNLLFSFLPISVLLLERFFSTLLTNSSTNFTYFCHHIFNVQEFFIFSECPILWHPIFFLHKYIIFFISPEIV